MAIIDLSNYATTLVQSTQGRAGTPDGNVYFDKTTDTIEFIPIEELATVDLTAVGGGATDPNPLTTQDGIKFEAIYAFENQERAIDETLRAFNRWTKGNFKFGGAYNFVEGRTPSTAADRAIIRGSGWNEFDAAGTATLIYFGNKGLSNIFSGSQPYYQLGVFATAVDFAKAGQIDEAVLVKTDGGTDNTLDPEIVSVRTYGNNYDRKATDVDLGIAELGGYSTGFALNESVHLTTSEASMPFADVYTTQTGVWVGMTLEELDTPVVVDEFVEASGSFTWVLNNPSGANLNQSVAYLDAIATVAAISMHTQQILLLVKM